MLDSQLMQSIYSWVKRVYPAEKVIWDRQGEVRPPKPYILLSITEGPTKRGYDDQRVDVDQKTVHSGAREFLASINYLGSDASSQLAKLQNAIEFQSQIDFLIGKGLSVIRDGGIRDLSKALENSFESRAQMDLTMCYVAAAKDEDSTTIVEVEIENEIDDTFNVIDTN